MTFQIFIQQRPENGYVASVIGIPSCLVEGATKEETVAKVKDALTHHLSPGEIVTVTIEDIHSQPDNPWLKISGKYKDDPTWDDFLASMEEYRRELDAEEAAREPVEHLEAA